MNKYTSKSCIKRRNHQNQPSRNQTFEEEKKIFDPEQYEAKRSCSDKFKIKAYI